MNADKSSTDQSPDLNPHPVPLRTGADEVGMTPAGLLKILRRTNSAIRDDGRWFAARSKLEAIKYARRILGLCRSR